MLRAPFFLLLSLLAAHADPFSGRLVFDQTVEGENAEELANLLAHKITIHIGTDGYRQDEEGGLNAGSYIVHRDSHAALHLDHEAKTTELGTATNLDDAKKAAKDLMVWHYATNLQKTIHTATICGQETTRYKVVQSAFVREGALAYVWIAAEPIIEPHRYGFRFPSREVVAPLPLSIPVETGIILKATVLENGSLVTITAAEITPGEPDPALFKKTKDYKGPDFPAPAKTLPAPDRPAVDSGTLPEAVTNSVGMSFILIKPGTFQMGSPADEPDRHDEEHQHEVTITRPYYLATTEVTQAQWKAVLGTDSPAHFKGDDLPVENATWIQANEFCKALSEKEGLPYRLPTEAEWEYAARAGENVEFKSMKMSERKTWLTERAWMSFNAQYKTHPVAGLKPNAWGLFDIFGNVSEWTSSGTGDYPAGPATDPQGTDSPDKIHRGSAWVSGHDGIRPAARSPHPSDQPKATIGFRVLREPK